MKPRAPARPHASPPIPMPSSLPHHVVKRHPVAHATSVHRSVFLPSRNTLTVFAQRACLPHAITQTLTRYVSLNNAPCRYAHSPRLPAHTVSPFPASPIPHQLSVHSLSLPRAARPSLPRLSWMTGTESATKASGLFSQLPSCSLLFDLVLKPCSLLLSMTRL